MKFDWFIYGFTAGILTMVAAHFLISVIAYG